MKLTKKEIEYIERFYESQFYGLNDDLRRYSGRLRIDKNIKNIIKEIKSEIKILNSIKSKFEWAKITDKYFN
tara:strand:+ start:7366 stop:7581 length:216 start_codon:yes stop_codon:yes gene_type:complete